MLVIYQFFGGIVRIFLYIKSCHVHKNSLNSSFLIALHLFSFCCLIALARTFSTLFNRNVENGHTCLVPHPRGKPFSLSPWSMTLVEKAMATHSSTLALKIPWMKEPGRLQSMGSLRVGHD